MAPFLRIAFNAYDVGVLPGLSEPPICAIKMKESVNTGMCRCTHKLDEGAAQRSRETQSPRFNCLNSHHLLGSRTH